MTYSTGESLPTPGDSRMDARSGTDAGKTRRELLRAAGGSALLLATGAGLAACGSSSSSSATTATSSGTPRRGGTLRVGVTSGSSSDTLDPDIWTTNADGTRIYQLFNSLTALDKNALPQLSLAEEVTPNGDATAWTIRVRSDVRWHDGTPLTADDVLFTFQRITNAKAPLEGAPNLAALNIGAARKLDQRTLRIPCHTPYAGLATVLACYQYFIVPVGFDPKNPIGTGPFKYKSFTPGEQAVFVRNDEYWQPGLPYVDEVIITDMTDETSQVNALLSNQVDVIDALSSDSLAALTGGGAKLLVSEGGSYTPFTMRVDQPPFNDIRVRQAFRLMIDREQMLKLVFGPYGLIGNDVFGIYDPDFDRSLPQRAADLEQARSLLKQAGQADLRVTLTTSDLAAGAVKAAQVLAQQASAIGATVALNQVPVSTMYGPNYLKWTFAQDVWTYYPYQPNASEVAIPGAPFNECHVDNPQYTKLFGELSATLEPSLRQELTHECMALDYDGQSSGYIIPHFVPALDGYAAHVHGLTPTKTSVPLGGFDLEHVWLS